MVEYIHSCYGHVNYNTILSIVYTHHEVAWVCKMGQEIKKDGVQYRVAASRSSPTSAQRRTWTPRVGPGSSPS